MKKKLSLLLGFCFLLGLVSQAQYDPKKVNKKAAKLYEQAMEAASNDDFKTGIKLLQNATKIDPQFADGFLSIAGMFGEMKKYDSAIYYYQQAKAIDADYFKDYNLPYSINLAGKGEFAKALETIEEFMQIPNLNERSVLSAGYRKKSYQFAIDYGKQHQLDNYLFNPINMGPNINSVVSEYYPTLTIDSQQLVFTRRIKNYNEDFFGAERNPEGGWLPSGPLTGNINTMQNEGAQTLSQDGTWLIFTGCNFSDGYGSCDLYISYLTNVGWSTPENLGPVINTEFWESAPSLSPDKRDLYFASKRPDGYGGSDIYVCHLMPNGKFGKPENLGGAINTSGDESCPFIHADNQTLYFTSNGLQGYGGDDLFMAKKGPKGYWSRPANLGYPINTIENEGSMIVASDGKTAYYASDRSEGMGGLDLYTFELRNEVRPAKTLWIKGKVYDKKTAKGLPSAVELTDLSTKELTNKVQTDENGFYLITLPVGKDYAFNVNRKGYLFYSENFSLKQKTPDSTYHIDIPLQPLEVNAAIVLRNIFFDSNSFELKPESTSELDRLVQLLKDNPTLTIEIAGHTDNVGKATDNLKLSQDRSMAVVKYLTQKGIEAKRLLSKGYGATIPIADNGTEEGKALNRRTEMKVINQ